MYRNLLQLLPPPGKVREMVGTCVETGRRRRRNGGN